MGKNYTESIKEGRTFCKGVIFSTGVINTEVVFNNGVIFNKGVIFRWAGLTFIPTAIFAMVSESLKITLKKQ